MTSDTHALSTMAWTNTSGVPKEKGKTGKGVVFRRGKVTENHVNQIIETFAKQHGFTSVRRLGFGGEAYVYLMRNEGESHAIRIGRTAYTHTELTSNAFHFFEPILVLQQGYNSPTDIQRRKNDEQSLFPRIHAMGQIPIGDRFVPYVNMDYLPGNALSHEPLQLDEIIAAACSVAETLHILHDEVGVPHRDVKPKNIIHCTYATWLIDVGVTNAVSLSYAAPELFGKATKKPADRRPADMFAYGVTFYETVTHSQTLKPSKLLPYTEEDIKRLERNGISTQDASAQIYREQILPVIRDGSYRSLHSFRGIPQELCEVLHACLEELPRNRPTASEVLKNIGELRTDWCLSS